MLRNYTLECCCYLVCPCIQASYTSAQSIFILHVNILTHDITIEKSWSLWTGLKRIYTPGGDEGTNHLLKVRGRKTKPEVRPPPPTKLTLGFTLPLLLGLETLRGSRARLLGLAWIIDLDTWLCSRFSKTSLFDILP